MKINKSKILPTILLVLVVVLLLFYSTKMLTRLGIPWIFRITDDGLYPPQNEIGIPVSKKWWHSPYSPMIYSTLLLLFLVTLLFRKKIEYKSHSALIAFLVSFLIEMYGVAFSLYLYFSMIHKPVALRPFWPPSNYTIFQHYIRFPVLIIGWSIGIAIIWKAWSRINQNREGLVTDGIYSYIRHPQHVGLMFIALGTLIFCPTPMQLILFIILMLMYYRLSIIEDKELESKFGDSFKQYKENTGRFFPKLRKN